MAKRIFVAFAMEDVRMRDLLYGQMRNSASPIEYTDMSVKDPWSNAWKTQCRLRIRGCHGVIALLSANSLTARGQLWEIGCAIEERVPLVGMHIYQGDRTTPPVMSGQRIINWTWDEIASFINSL